MKLVIQIPCYNEEGTLPVTFRDLPRRLDDVDSVEILVVDDGSTDRTVDVARSLGVHHVLSLGSHHGLARAFAAGLENSLALGADIVVNTDADNQYSGRDIEALVRPVLSRQADIVVGTRDMSKISEFSALKKALQRVGSSFVRRITGTRIPDATSGFRAYSREAALRINVFSDFTYTIETIIQASEAGLRIAHVPVGTNPKLRESRLFTSTGVYVARSLTTIVRIYTMYNPLRVFSLIAALFIGGGLVLVARFLYFYVTLAQVQTGHVQSLIAASILLVIGFQIFLFGLLADLTAKNRKLLESILLRLKEQEKNK